MHKHRSVIVHYAVHPDPQRHGQVGQSTIGVQGVAPDDQGEEEEELVAKCPDSEEGDDRDENGVGSAAGQARDVPLRVDVAH